jgi:uncharacterized membrane protein YgcG
LFFTLILTLVWTMVCLVCCTRRTRRGNRALKRFKAEQAHVPALTRNQPEQVEPALLGLAVGLFGAAALSGTDGGPLGDLRKALQASQWQGGGVSGSSDWSSSSGGGGCGGGGGGGGGGCGGCGG